MIAYCFRDGKIKATDEATIPEGALELYRGPHRKVLRVIADTTDDQQIAGLDKSTGLTEDFRILTDYLEMVREKENTMVTVSELTLAQVENEVAANGS